MKHSHRRAILRMAMAGLAAVPAWALAQPYPSKTVTLVAPYAPGGALDIVARALAPKLSASMGQQFIVENKPGASGNIGTEQVTRSAPDGYTLAILPDSNLTVNPHVFAGMRFNPQKDLAPVSMLSTISIALVVNPSVPAKNVTELLAYGKTLPGGLSFGSPGNGTPHHLAGELMQQMSGVNMVHVPYKGGSPAVLDVVGNQIPSAFVALGIAAPHIKAGKLRLIGMTGRARSSEFPDVPTIGETLKGFEVTSWIGLFAPAATPAAVIDKLNGEVRKALGDAATAQALSKQSLDVVLSSPAELKDRIQSESARWEALIKAKGITLQ